MTDPHAPLSLARIGVQRVPVPVPFIEAGGPANVYVIEEEGGGLALFDAGIATPEGEAALLEGFRAIGRSLSEVRRIFVSHGHIDHYGYAKATQELSGAPVVMELVVLDQNRINNMVRLDPGKKNPIGRPDSANIIANNPG